MTRNIFIKTKRTDGFSLLEMAVVMAIIVVLTTAIAPVAVRQAQIKAGEKSAREINIIQEAARKYYIDNNSWPGSLVDLKTGGYLNNAWITKNPWGFDYSTLSDASTFSVQNKVPLSIVNLLVRTLPSSSSLADVVTSTIPTPGTLSLAPAKVVVMWSGSIADIPSGWALCDGTNGTPDLRERFIVGARQDVGGIPETNVSGVLTKIGGEAKHTLTIAEMPAHSHNFSTWQDRTGSAGGETERPKFDTIGTTSSTGGGQPHNILPPYYALAFIMKL